jgi:hypothetical protein
MSSTDITTLAPCAWPLDADGYGRLSDLRLDAPPCALPRGFRGWVLSVQLVDEYGHPMDAELRDYRCEHRDTSEWKVAHRKQWSTRAAAKEKPMDEVKPPEVVPPVMVSAPVVTTAAVAVPADAPPDVMALIPKDGSASVLTVLLALIVMAGAVAWKFGPGWMEAKREREAKQLELEEKKLEQQASQHVECKVARDELALKVAWIESQSAGLSARVDEIAGKIEQQGSLAVAGDDADKRLGKVEKALKTLQRAQAALKKGKS